MNKRIRQASSVTQCVRRILKIPRIQALAPDTNLFIEKMAEKMSANMGLSANSLITMAHWPELAQAFSRLSELVNFTESELPVSIKRLVSHVVSRSSGCQYCAAHTGF